MFDSLADDEGEMMGNIEIVNCQCEECVRYWVGQQRSHAAVRLVQVVVLVVVHRGSDAVITQTTRGTLPQPRYRPLTSPSIMKPDDVCDCSVCQTKPVS